MQIGIDLGASKIESVVLSDDGKEHLREREIGYLQLLRQPRESSHSGRSH